MKQKLFLYLFEMNSLQKCGYRGIRQKKLNFRCRSLVQFKVMWKLFFCKCQKLFLYPFEMNSLQKRGYRNIRQKQMNFRCRSFVYFKVTWILFVFWNINSYSCTYSKWIHSKKRGYRGIKQKQLIFRCRSLVQIKVTWKLFFWNVKSYFCIYSITFCLNKEKKYKVSLLHVFKCFNINLKQP